MSAALAGAAWPALGNTACKEAIMSDPNQPWASCKVNHGSTYYQVTITTTEDAVTIGESIIPDSSLWLKEISCGKCSRRWLGCSLCSWRCPKPGNLSGRKRGRNGSPDALFAVLMEHRNSQSHQDKMPQPVHATSVASDSSFNDSGDHLMALNDDDSASSVTMGNMNEVVPPTCTILSSCDQSDTATQSLLLSYNENNTALSRYLQQENSERMMGARHIVSMACDFGMRIGQRHTSYHNPAPAYGTQFLVTYTELFQDLSVEKRHKLVRLVDAAFKTPPAERCGALFGRAKVPCTITEANRICLTGSNSISKLLPLPRMELVGQQKEQHVCVHPLDAIQHAFAHMSVETSGKLKVVTQTTVPPEMPTKVSSYFESKDYQDELRKTVEILKRRDEECCVQIMIRWFSDAWDPDGTKRNRNGVWSMFMTLMFGPGLDEVVFPVAAGPKSGDHAVAVQWVLNEIKKLGETFIVRDVVGQRNVRTRVATALIQVDRLERGELWGGLHHAANRGRCYGVVAGYDTVSHPCYAACAACTKKLVNSMLSDELDESNGCNKCAAYDATSKLLTGPMPKAIQKAKFLSTFDGNLGELLEKDTSQLSPEEQERCAVISDPSIAPPGRPVGGEDTQGEGASAQVLMYGPVEADQAFLIAAAQFLTYQVWKGVVKTKELAKCWGQACGLSEELSLSLFSEAKAHRACGTSNFGLVFTKDLLPPAWLYASWCQAKFLNAPMHLLFLGVLDTLMEMIDQWLSFHSLKTSFNQNSSSSCDATGKLGLQWLRLLKYGVSTLSRGLWVSEQYCAFAKYMIIPFAGLMFAKAPCPEEIRIVLQAVDSCFLTISLLMKRSIGPLDISRSVASMKVYLAAVDELGRLLHHREKWKKGASKFSGCTEPTPANGQRRNENSTSAITLSAAPSAAATTGTNNSTGVNATGVATKNGYRLVSLNNPNHASLLSIADSMRSHGPPCDQWEGKKGGEASIQDVKPFFQGICTVDGGNMIAAMRRYYRSRLLSEMGDALEESGGGGLFSGTLDNVPGRNRYTHARRYKSLEQVRDLLGGKSTDITEDDITEMFDSMEDVSESNIDDLMGGISGHLYESQDTNEQAICVSVVNIDDKKGPALLHQIEISDVRSFYSLLCPISCPEASNRSFGEDFLFVGKLMLTDTVFDPVIMGYEKTTQVVIVPARQTWREKKYVVQSDDNEKTLESYFSVVTDDFRRLAVDGGVPESTRLTPSLWKDVGEDGTVMQVDWDEVIKEKGMSLSLKTNAELSAILKANKKPYSGNKAVLIERVMALYAEQNAGEETH